MWVTHYDSLELLHVLQLNYVVLKLRYAALWFWSYVMNCLIWL